MTSAEPAKNGVALQWFGAGLMLSRSDTHASAVALARGDGALLVHAGWKGNIAKQGLGKSSAGHQSIVKGCRAEKLGSHLAECRLAGRQEPEGVYRCREPEPSSSKKCREALLEKELQQILRGVGFVAQVFDLSEPVQAFGFEANAFVYRRWRRALAKSLRCLGDQLRRNVLMVVEHASFAKQGCETRRVGEIFGDGGMFTIADIDQPVSHPDHFLPVGGTLHQDDEIDIAVRRHRAPGAGSDENNTHQVAAALNALGYKNWRGEAFTPKKVIVIRTAYALKSRFERLRARGMLTARELATQLGVCSASIYQWGREGLITEHRYGHNHRCLYEPPGEVVLVKGQGGRYASTPPRFIAAPSTTQGAS